MKQGLLEQELNDGEVGLVPCVTDEVAAVVGFGVGDDTVAVELLMSTTGAQAQRHKRIWTNTQTDRQTDICVNMQSDQTDPKC